MHHILTCELHPHLLMETVEVAFEARPMWCSVRRKDDLSPESAIKLPDYIKKSNSAGLSPAPGAFIPYNSKIPNIDRLPSS
jgi:hypothetical protein